MEFDLEDLWKEDMRGDNVSYLSEDRMRRVMQCLEAEECLIHIEKHLRLLERTGS